MKKVIFILLGISFILGGIIFVLYKNNYSKSDDVVDIFKEKDDSDNNSNDDIIEEMKDDTNTVIVDIKGMVVNPGVYEVPSSFRVNDQTTPSMIQRISGSFERKPLISKEI